VRVLRELRKATRPIPVVITHDLALVLRDGRRQGSVTVNSGAASSSGSLLELLELCAERKWRPRWLLNASSTSSLLGYAGQSNYCAANGLLDQMATFGLPDAVQRALDVPPLVLTLNFGPWGEVGMAREGTKAHEQSLRSGERPMASSVAIAGIAEALRELRAAATSGRLHTSATEAPGAARAPHTRGLQFAIADVEWWRSPWPSHSLVQGIMRRVPTPEAVLNVMVGDDDDEAADERPIRKGVARKGASFKDEGAKSGGSTRSPRSVAPGTGAMSGGSGEQALITSGCAQMGHFYGLTVGSAAGMCDAKLPDMQAGYEKGVTAGISAMTGINLMYESAGMHASLLGFCHESLLIDNDMLGSINRNVRGIEVNEDTLSLEVIKQVCLEGPGHYLGSEQTLELMQKEYVYPLVANRMSPKEWVEAGRPDLLETATRRKNEILSNYYPDYLPREIDDVLRRDHRIFLPREVMEPGDPRWS
jgi:hypothetical protein